MHIGSPRAGVPAPAIRFGTGKQPPKPQFELDKLAEQFARRFGNPLARALTDAVTLVCGADFMLESGVVTGLHQSEGLWIGTKDEATMKALGEKMVAAGQFTLLAEKRERTGLFSSVPVAYYEFQGQRVRLDTRGMKD